MRVIARVKFYTHVFCVYFACKSAILQAIYTRVNAAIPVACIVVLTFNRNCEDYNDQKDIYPREHQFPQGLHVFGMYFACKSAILHAIYTRVNAAIPVACIVVLTFNRNCEDYNDQKDIYPREHQFPQGLPCADFLRILVTSGSEVQGILKALVH